MRDSGIDLSDRRAVRAQTLVAAAAALDGRVSAAVSDLWVLPMIAPTADDQSTAQEALHELISEAESASLVHAAEQPPAAGVPVRRVFRLPVRPCPRARGDPGFRRLLAVPQSWRDKPSERLAPTVSVGAAVTPS